MKCLFVGALILSLTAPTFADPLTNYNIGYGAGYGLGSLLSNWGSKRAQKKLEDDINAMYAPCTHGVSLADDTDASSKLIGAANSYSGELGLRLSVLALQCRVIVDEHANVGSDMLYRDEALGRMVDAHTANPNTLDLATNALIRIHKLQAITATPPVASTPDAVETEKRVRIVVLPGPGPTNTPGYVPPKVLASPTQSHVTTPAPQPFDKCNVEATTIKAVAPVTPDLAQQQGITGVVSVVVKLDEYGKIIGTPSIQSSPSQLLNEAAIDAAEKSTFQTEIKDCHPVKATYIFVVQYNNN